VNARSLILALSIIGLSGCSGVKFAAAPVNAPLPEVFKGRAVYPANVAAYEFEDLVGNVLLIRPNTDPLRVGVIRPRAYKLAVIPITNPENYYHSRIQHGAEAQGSYLGFAAGFSRDQMAELTIIDAARAGIELSDNAVFASIIEDARNWVKQHPKGDSNSKRLWLKAVVLSRRIYSASTQIKANASSQVGEVVGVKTGVYRKDEESSKSAILGFDAFDIDELVEKAGGGMAFTGSGVPLESARFTGVIEGPIRKSEPEPGASGRSR